MAEKYEEIAVVVDQSSLGNGIYDLTLKTDKIAKAAKAGQFVSVYSNDKSKLLPRPISLCGINRDDDTIRLVYRVTGEGTGTEEFSKLVRGDKVQKDFPDLAQAHSWIFSDLLETALQYSRERRPSLSAEESECRLCCSLPRI